MKFTIKSTPPPHINSQNSQRSANIDCLKALCAMLVVCNHTSFLHASALYYPAVPCFLMISGFLIYNDDAEKFRQRVLKNLVKIVKITFWATLLYFLYFFIFHYNFFLPHFSLKMVTNAIIFNNPPFGDHLWYLFAYIEVLIIIYFFSWLNIINSLKYIVPILLIISVICSKYSFLFGSEEAILPTRNFLFSALPFFFIGIWIKQNFEIIRLKIKRPLVLMIIFMMLTAVELYYIKTYHYQATGGGFFFLIFYSFFLFLTFIFAPKLKENCFSNIGKDLSLYIYIFHVLFIFAYDGCRSIFHSVILDKYDVLFEFPLVFSMTLLASFLFFKVKNLIFQYFENA